MFRCMYEWEAFNLPTVVEVGLKTNQTLSFKNNNGADDNGIMAAFKAVFLDYESKAIHHSWHHHQP